MDRRTFVATLGAAAAACAAPGVVAGQEPPPRGGVAPGRVGRLARGVNLSHWMWYPHAQGEQARRAFIPPAELAALAAAGLTHVRLPFEPSWLWDDATGALRAAECAEYQDAARRCLDAGLAVVVDAHWSRTPWIRPRGASHAGRFGELERMWRALAARLDATDPDRVFLELLNEPHDLADADHWHDAQRRIAAAVRGAAGRHTIIATGAEYGGIDGLLRLAPLEDGSTVYSFHFYSPHNFTHQGATWGFPPWKGMKDVPWPAERGDLERLADTLPKDSREALRWSAREGTTDPWTPGALRAQIGRAAEWARRHKAAVYCGEFGVHAAPAPRESRLRWHREVGAALQEAGIGWAMWDDVGGFRLATGPPGARELDAELGAALGLEQRPVRKPP
ncbi:MAG: cellulase family glycosylhydrolase [Phycisphaerales bacterium]